jgi:hypothetical protein
VDIDGDGNRDILSGSYSRDGEDMAGLFQVLYGKPDGTFHKAAALKGTDGEPLIIPLNGRPFTENICTRPFAVDWDGDGQLDVVAGNFVGTFYWFRGEGRGKFQPKPEEIMAGDAPLRIQGHHSDPFAIDWDGDGDLDLLSGSSNGGVQWAENTAAAGRVPELNQFRDLINPGRSIAHGEPLSEKDLTGPTSATRVWAADVNGDGKLDLLVGDCVTLISPAKGLTTAQFKKKLAAWEEAVAKASQELSAKRNAKGNESDEADETTEAEEKAAEKFNKVYNQRSEFMTEDRTGFVWLYLQK